MTRMEKAHERYSMSDILSRYGIETNRHNFIVCPFHKDKHPSCKIYKDGFKCYSCGTHGDLVDFVAKLEGISLREALDILEVDRMSCKEASEYEKRRKEEQKFQSWCEKRKKLAVLRLDYFQKRLTEITPLSEEWCEIANRIPLAWQEFEICFNSDRKEMQEIYILEKQGEYIDFALSVFIER